MLLRGISQIVRGGGDISAVGLMAVSAAGQHWSHGWQAQHSRGQPGAQTFDAWSRETTRAPCPGLLPRISLLLLPTW